MPCPVIKANGKLQQLNSGKTINGPEPSGMKIWVMPPGREPLQSEAFAEGKWNTEWVEGEGSYKYQPCDQLQKLEL